MATTAPPSAGTASATATNLGLGSTLVLPADASEEPNSVLQDLKKQLDSEKDKNRHLEESYKYRVASFVQRETQTRTKIEALEKQVNQSVETPEQNAKMGVIRNMHRDVVDSLDLIQMKTATMLQEQERDLMRAFRNRLTDVAKEHEELKSKKGEHSSELQAKHRKVLGELYEAQELAQSFDRQNQQLQAENKKLQDRLQGREDDRQALLKELMHAKKDLVRNQHLVKELNETMAGVPKGGPKAPSPQAATGKKPFTEKQIEQAKLQSTHNRLYEREIAYRENITKLKRTLEVERERCRGLHQQRLEMVQRRSELEALLRQCLDDVKAELLRKRGFEPSGPSSNGSGDHPFPTQSVESLSVHELTPQDRERVLELLLSQQRAVQLLYSRSFFSSGGAAAAPAAAAAAAAAEDGRSGSRGGGRRGDDDDD
eukprot:CAMPEP_0206565254 /NCGR_PEP_ID=MMETSP0325_2-20121206/23969_1 /ASSEMBLY_ACC=CAM_ASM_000347 /TAXON_ID=2866 /ORGANISM="Crypthecodinium cohnii, Strain Seligo" /LENGTH=428 /DNA_ID=CAMNT_0054068089 /DNA_START=116 /DNA_END=1399 /DNA_ORIENTATION=-